MPRANCNLPDICFSSLPILKIELQTCSSCARLLHIFYTFYCRIFVNQFSSRIVCAREYYKLFSTASFGIDGVAFFFSIICFGKKPLALSAGIIVFDSALVNWPNIQRWFFASLSVTFFLYPFRYSKRFLQFFFSEIRDYGSFQGATAFCKKKLLSYKPLASWFFRNQFENLASFGFSWLCMVKSQTYILEAISSNVRNFARAKPTIVPIGLFCACSSGNFDCVFLKKAKFFFLKIIRSTSVRYPEWYVFEY